MLNPYIAGAPVVEASMFFGREDVFGWIERSLEGKYVNHILVLHGQRRVGKTSVLKQIPNFLPDKYIQVFFDLQGRTGTTMDRFLWWLASEIVRTLKREHGLDIPKPDRKAFEDTEYLINEFLPGLRPVLGDYVLLLTFDEFDSLDRTEIREALSRPLIAYLRRLIEMKGLNFIFSIGSSGDKLENMQASYTDFFKSALYRKISFLTEDDCQRLITKPVEGLIKYDKKAVGRISEITSGHPYFTQLMCHELFSHCQKTGARTISAGDVEAVLEDVVERGTVNLKFVWDEASDLEKWILATLAQMDGGDNQKLAQALTAQHVRYSETDLNSAVIHLRDKDVITKENRFVIHLMRLWLVANRPTDRVREELVEVNPIANRYIEIGDEYRDRGQTQQAIESYQQALNVNPGNLKAQTNIASVHLDQKEYDQAATAFELALKIDDEDVVAKTGYCEANLALGNAAHERDEDDQALAIYQKILVINAAHSDARQRSAAIYRGQAERQLAAGQEEEALDSFKRAMEFVPEDDSLSSRYDEVLAQKKAKLVAGWLGKVEKALSRQRWDEAAEMVEEAIKVDPENKELSAKLVEVKDAPRQFKLQGYRREAEGAITRGNWEKAIAALETAVLLAPEDKSLRDQLDTVRNDQLNAQFELHRKAAEKAIAAGDWEAALAARQAALKLAPENPDLRRALEETHQAQHQAQLDFFQKQVDEAIAGEKWDEAIQAVKAAIKFAPKEDAWKEKLAEVEAARHQAQLRSLRAQAEAARKAQNWDEAIATLENYQKLGPSEAKVQAEIEVLRAEKRESELRAFKAQAERATKAESWDEALAAWESYLTLEPDDKADIEGKLQHARKYAKIAGDYTEAQEAIRKKRYGRAIELLQGIIAQEPTYKSTSRLLVEAVEANKAIPFWRRPWLLPAVGAITLLMLGIFFGPQAWNAISIAIADRPIAATEASGSEDATSVPEIDVTAAPATVTQDPTPTATDLASVTEQETAFYEPILAYTESEPPTFADDFSTEKSEWGKNSYGGLVTNMRQASALQVTESREPDLTFPTNELFKATDFVLAFDFYPDKSQADSVTGRFGLIFRSSQGIGAYYNFNLSYSKHAVVDAWQMFETDGTTARTTKIGQVKLNDNYNRILIVARHEYLAIFVNDQLLHMGSGLAERGNENYFISSGPGGSSVKLDNVKFWNLDGVEFSTSTNTPTPEPAAPESSPDWVTDFAEPILIATVDRAPDFQDDFEDSSTRFAWSITTYSGSPADKLEIANGVIAMIADGEQESYASHEKMRFNNFVLTVDADLTELGQGKMGIEAKSAYTDDTVSFRLNKFGQWDVYLNKKESSKFLAGIHKVTSIERISITILLKDTQYAVFINEIPLGYIDNTGQSPGYYKKVEIFHHPTSYGENVIKFDNLKIWDLDAIDLEQ